MSEITIWKALKAAGLTDAGAAGLIGNMKCESAMKANNVQDGMGYGDEEYTACVDSGKIGRESFQNDARGYGLCQWTFYSRKAGLYDYAKSRGLSIGDEDMQVQFCLQEFPNEAPDTFRLLKTSDDVYKCAEWVCKYYERPAVNNVQDRYNAALTFLGKYSGTTGCIPAASEPEPEIVFVTPSGPCRPSDPEPEIADKVLISRTEYNFLTRCASALNELKNIFDII